MKNMDIRCMTRAKRIFGYEIAQQLNISRSKYYEMLQRDLTDDERARIMKAMDAAVEEREREFVIG